MESKRTNEPEFSSDDHASCYMEMQPVDELEQEQCSAILSNENEHIDSSSSSIENETEMDLAIESDFLTICRRELPSPVQVYLLLLLLLLLLFTSVR